MLGKLLKWNPASVGAFAALLIAIIAIADWRIEFNATLGFLYMFPLMLLGIVLDWWAIVLAAVFCTFLSDRLDPFPFEDEIYRDALIFLALAITGLLSKGLAGGYRRESASLAKLTDEMAARRAAEEQLEFLIHSSPAAILIADREGEILLANPAAHRMFAIEGQPLGDSRIAGYVPALGSIAAAGATPRTFRTAMQTRAVRQSGDIFLADVLFSTYETAAGARIAALVVDASEHFREKEEASLEQLLAGSQILVAAVSHEVRNVSGAIGLVHENLTRSGVLAGNQDFEALGSLVQTLSKIASLELKSSVEKTTSVDLNEVLADLRIVLESIGEESGLELVWDVPAGLPQVQAERHKLLQVLLNLIKNSQRALEEAALKVISIAVELESGRALIHVSDTGPGIPAGQKLFQPLQKGADATGLGLYLSRAFLRSFGGDLRHQPQQQGCSFVLELLIPREVHAQISEPWEHASNPAVTS